MNTAEQNIGSFMDNLPDEGVVNYSQNSSAVAHSKPGKLPNANARRRIEEYEEAKLLRNLTRGVFED